METTETTKSIPLTFLKKHGYLDKCLYSGKLKWWIRGEPNGSIDIIVDSQDRTIDNYMRLTYTVTIHRTGTSEDMVIQIPLLHTSPYFGGKRWVFECPLYKSGKYCGARVRTIYSVDKYFGCRECADLVYDCQTTPVRLKGFPWKTLDYERKESEITRKYYKGKPTKRYKRLLNKLNRSFGNRSNNDIYKDIADLL